MFRCDCGNMMEPKALYCSRCGMRLPGNKPELKEDALEKDRASTKSSCQEKSCLNEDQIQKISKWVGEGWNSIPGLFKGNGKDDFHEEYKLQENFKLEGVKNIVFYLPGCGKRFGCLLTIDSFYFSDPKQKKIIKWPAKAIFEMTLSHVRDEDVLWIFCFPIPLSYSYASSFVHRNEVVGVIGYPNRISMSFLYHFWGWIQGEEPVSEEPIWDEKKFSFTTILYIIHGVLGIIGLLVYLLST